MEDVEQGQGTQDAVPPEQGSALLVPEVKRKGNPFKPGHPKFGGRKPGSKNKRTKRAQELAESMGVDPVTFMLEILRSEAVQVVLTNPDTGATILDEETGQPKRVWMAVPLEMKLDAAKAVAAYIHPKLQATQVTGKDDGPVEVNTVDMNKLLADPAAVEAAQKLALTLAEAEAARPIE